MCAVLAPAADAHKKKTASEHQLTVTQGGANDVFDGVVSSKKAACERGRSITLFRVVGGDSAPDVTVSTATTDADGTWSKAVANAPDGSYYAKAAKKKKKKKGHKHVCKAATSNTVVVDTPAGPDNDGDGFTVAEGDCDDENPARNPGETETDNAIDDDCDGDVDEGFDVDADGFTVSTGDCDDSNPDVNPDATEVDDTIDNDCDGAVDEGFDADVDGFTPNGGDCDDTDVAVNPDATEVDNGKDDNCDGVVDEGFDIDNDGFTPNGGDCNDADPAINPDATEIPANGIDEDCDAEVDET